MRFIQFLLRKINALMEIHLLSCSFFTKMFGKSDSTAKQKYRCNSNQNSRIFAPKTFCKMEKLKDIAFFKFLLANRAPG